MIRLACVLACAFWLGAACSRAKTEKAMVNPDRQSVIENAGEFEKPAAAQPRKSAVKSKPARQTMTRSEYEKRALARQKYLKRRQAWIAAHPDRFRALPE